MFHGMEKGMPDLTKYKERDGKLYCYDPVEDQFFIVEVTPILANLVPLEIRAELMPAYRKRVR